MISPSLPSTCHSAGSQLWNFQPWLLGNVICKLSQFLSEGCTFASILHITALSVERYLAVCFPLHAKVLVTRGKVKALIGGLWMVALLSAGPVFALVGVEQLDDSGGTECRCTQYAKASGLLGTMMWLSNLYFLVPVCCLSLLYGLIGRRLWHRRHCAHRERANRQTVKMLGKQTRLMGLERQRGLWEESLGIYSSFRVHVLASFSLLTICIYTDTSHPKWS